jgi:hypothetical protein
MAVKAPFGGWGLVGHATTALLGLEQPAVRHMAARAAAQAKSTITLFFFINLYLDYQRARKLRKLVIIFSNRILQKVCR